MSTPASGASAQASTPNQSDRATLSKKKGDIWFGAMSIDRIELGDTRRSRVTYGGANLTPAEHVARYLVRKVLAPNGNPVDGIDEILLKDSVHASLIIKEFDKCNSIATWYPDDLESTHDYLLTLLTEEGSLQFSGGRWSESHLFRIDNEPQYHYNTPWIYAEKWDANEIIPAGGEYYPKPDGAIAYTLEALKDDGKSGWDDGSFHFVNSHETWAGQDKERDMS